MCREIGLLYMEDGLRHWPTTGGEGEGQVQSRSPRRITQFPQRYEARFVCSAIGTVAESWTGAYYCQALEALWRVHVETFSPESAVHVEGGLEYCKWEPLKLAACAAKTSTAEMIVATWHTTHPTTVARATAMIHARSMAGYSTNARRSGVDRF